jgi:hypothetical protein
MPIHMRETNSSVVVTDSTERAETRSRERATCPRVRARCFCRTVAFSDLLSSGNSLPSYSARQVQQTLRILHGCVNCFSSSPGHRMAAAAMTT